MIEVTPMHFCVCYADKPKENEHFGYVSLYAVATQRQLFIAHDVCNQFLDHPGFLFPLQGQGMALFTVW